MLVLILQISVGGRTLEDYLMSFVHTSDSLAPVRDIAYSGVRKIHPSVQIGEAEERSPASISNSSEQQTPVVRIDLFGDILKTFLLQYQNVLKGALQSSKTVENYSVNVEKELNKTTDAKIKETKKPSNP